MKQCFSCMTESPQQYIFHSPIISNANQILLNDLKSPNCPAKLFSWPKLRPLRHSSCCTGNACHCSAHLWCQEQRCDDWTVGVDACLCPSTMQMPQQSSIAWRCGTALFAWWQSKAQDTEKHPLKFSSYFSYFNFNLGSKRNWKLQTLPIVKNQLTVHYIVPFALQRFEWLFMWRFCLSAWSLLKFVAQFGAVRSMSQSPP